MLISLVAVPDMAEAATKSYLVLIENKDGKWTAYQDLAYASGDYLMVKAYSTSKALGLTYKINNKTLTIQNGKKKLTLTKNSKSYEYNNGSSTSKKTAAYKTYAATIAKKSTYVVHYSVLENLVSTTYFKGSNKTAYKKYDGVICYSLSDNNLTLSDIPTKVPTSIPTEAPKPTEKPVKEDKEVGYDGTTTIGNIKVPKLDGFADTLDKTSWGADDYTDGDDTNDYMYDALQAYSAQMVADIKNMHIEDNSGDLTQLAIKNDAISAEITGGSSNAALILSKNAEENCFEIYISTRLSKNPNKDETDYSKILQNTLKLFCNVITNNGNELYNLIYNHAELDSSLISKNSWTTVGNCQVTYSAKNGALTYSIKSK
jgi:hypothetical protein